MARLWARWTTAMLVALLGSFLFVASANAAFVGRTGNNDFALLFSASDFETNTVTVTFADNVFTVTDTTSALTAGGYCDSVDLHTVTCVRDAGSPTNTPIWQVIVILGDGNDSVWTEVPFETHLTGSVGDDSMTYLGNVSGGLIGGDGNDTLVSGSGEDYLEGDGGNDRLADGGGPRGRLVGGDGDDILRGGGGPDCLKGDAGVDRLIGGAGRDALHGGSAADALSGGYGHDVLKGGGGSDIMSGGAQRDAFIARDSRPDHLRGGSGFDRAAVDRRLDVRVGIEKLVSSVSFPTWCY
jgi:Ca2+-binding RTX toxin-like protein